jgi:hypothetical protein
MLKRVLTIKTYVDGCQGEQQGRLIAEVLTVTALRTPLAACRQVPGGPL